MTTDELLHSIRVAITAVEAMDDFTLRLGLNAGLLDRRFERMRDEQGKPIPACPGPKARRS